MSINCEQRIENGRGFPAPAALAILHTLLLTSPWAG